MTAAYVLGRHWAEDLHLLPDDAADSAGHAGGRVKLHFTNSAASTVVLDWRATLADGSSGNGMETFSTSFKPTALARRAGTSNDFYVVGWSEKTARVIVEKWSIPAPCLDPLWSLQDGTAVHLVIIPTIVRSLEWVSEPGQFEPIWGAACSPFANVLLLLESGSETKIISLDLDTVLPTVLYSSADPGFEDLQGLRSFAVAMHGSGNFLIIGQPKKPWETLIWQGLDSKLFVLQDTDLDGVTESADFMTQREFVETFQSPWDRKYSEPDP